MHTTESPTPPSPDMPSPSQAQLEARAVELSVPDLEPSQPSAATAPPDLASRTAAEDQARQEAEAQLQALRKELLRLRGD